MVKTLVEEQNVNVNTRDVNGWTPLHVACRQVLYTVKFNVCIYTYLTTSSRYSMVSYNIIMVHICTIMQCLYLHV